MKRARWMVVGAVLLGSCGWVASSGVAQQRMKPAVASVPAQVAPKPIVQRSPGAAEKKILEALDEPVSFSFNEQPLTDVIAFIKDKHKLQIFFDSTVLNDAGKDPSTILITCDLNGISVRSALRLILSGQGLTYYIQDEVLKVTTKGNADETFETRLYDVRDLTTNDRQPGGPADFESLIKTIIKTVPGDWSECSKQAAISEFSSGGVVAIAVKQTFEGHERVESLLAELRRLKPQR